MYLKLTKFFITIMLLLALVLIQSDLGSYSNQASISSSNSDVIILDDAQNLSVDSLLITSHQASHFNHSQQRKINYVFVVLIALFICLTSIVYYQIPIVHSPPWFCFIGLSKKSRLSGWKESNLLYKAKLIYQS
ncbi:MAG: hypothetical protein HRT52_03135 [Colwellia sp.]|nr:hypothetical protein [Colwellia sp.]